MDLKARSWSAPPIPVETKALIVRMATENGWRARKIQAELSKLGIELSLATISRYLPKTQLDPTSQQRWMTFLRNHRGLIAAMDFFVVPTVHFRLLYVWFAIDHGRRACTGYVLLGRRQLGRLQLHDALRGRRGRIARCGHRNVEHPVELCARLQKGGAHVVRSGLSQCFDVLVGE